MIQVGTKYEQFAGSTNFKKPNTLPKVETYTYRASLQTVMQCMPLWCQLSGKDDVSMSVWLDIDLPTLGQR